MTTKYKLSFEECLRARARNDPKCLAARMLSMERSELIALIGIATPSQGASPQTWKHELVQLVTEWRNYARYAPHRADMGWDEIIDQTALPPPSAR